MKISELRNNPDTVVNCPTSELYFLVLDKLEANGINVLPAHRVDNQDRCLRIDEGGRLKRSDLNFYVTEGFDIVDADVFLESNKSILDIRNRR